MPITELETMGIDRCFGMVLKFHFGDVNSELAVGHPCGSGRETAGYGKRSKQGNTFERCQHLGRISEAKELDLPGAR